LEQNNRETLIFYEKYNFPTGKTFWLLIQLNVENGKKLFSIRIAEKEGLKVIKGLKQQNSKKKKNFFQKPLFVESRSHQHLKSRFGRANTRNVPLRLEWKSFSSREMMKKFVKHIFPNFLSVFDEMMKCF
jgi:hypothetical protein